MNQKSRQNATTDVEKDFYKLLNSSNFGIDCRSNIDNRILKPFYDELREIPFIKKYDDIFDSGNYYQFANPDIMREEMYEKLDRLTLILDKDNPTDEARKYSYHQQRESNLDAVNSMDERRKCSGKKTAFQKIDDKTEQLSKSRTTKMIVDFCAEDSVSIKSFAAKEKKEMEAASRFLSGKMLMFAKLSLVSFIYEMLETFCFQDKKVKEIYEKYQMEKVHMYHILTDTNSTALKFLIISDPVSEIPKTKYREIIFEGICASDIVNRFDASHDFWAKFGFQKPELRKFLGYYAVANINNPCHLTIAFNPKKYFEMFEDKGVNKKHEGIKKVSSGTCFESFVARIVSVTNLDHFQKPSVEYKELARLTVNQGEMQKEESLRSKFSQFNDKRFYFSNGITSLPLFHPLLKNQAEYKKK